MSQRSSFALVIIGEWSSRLTDLGIVAVEKPRAGALRHGHLPLDDDRLCLP